MRSQMTPEFLSKLLEELEPAEIRAKYASELSASAASEALLRAFEQLDDDLALLKSQEMTGSEWNWERLQELGKQEPQVTASVMPFTRWRKTQYLALSLAACLVFALLLQVLKNPLPNPSSASFEVPQQPAPRLAQAPPVLNQSAPTEKVVQLPPEPSQELLSLQEFKDSKTQPAKEAGLTAKSMPSPVESEMKDTTETLHIQLAKPKQAAAAEAARERNFRLAPPREFNKSATKGEAFEARDTAQEEMQPLMAGSTNSPPQPESTAFATQPDATPILQAENRDQTLANQPKEKLNPPSTSAVKQWVASFEAFLKAITSGQDAAAPAFAKQTEIHWDYLGSEAIPAHAFATRVKARMQHVKVQVVFEYHSTQIHLLWREDEQDEWRICKLELDPNGHCHSWLALTP